MEWQPIETAPGDESYFLAYDANNGCYDVASHGWYEGGKSVWWNGDVSVTPTHWMPLPAPPSSD